MKPTVLFFVTFIFNLLCYSISTGKPQQQGDFKEKDAEELRPYGYAPANPGVKPISSLSLNQGYNSGPVSSLVKISYDCYSCIDCPDIHPNITVKECGFNKCVVYSEKFNDVTRPVYIRGCANERGNCEDIRKSHEGHPNIVKLLSCHECYGDKCNTNGVSKSMPDIAVALFFLIVSPLLTKHTMS